MNKHTQIIFVGMSKNCFSTLEKNLKFLEGFKQNSKTIVKICIVDSDSTDGTKDYCKALIKKNNIDYFLEIDNLEEQYDSRIQRLSICRNKALEVINKIMTQSVIYIPMDMDIDLFKRTDIKNFQKIIDQFSENTGLDAIFPFSTPFYYDIFALRKKGWVNKNNLLIARKLKDKLKLFSFLINYIYIFRKQLSPSNFDENLISVESAFGGIGMYKIDKFKIENLKYTFDTNSINYVTEHLSFNNSFNNLFILKNWNIDAPKEYIFWNLYNPYEKLIYVIKSIKNDLKGLARSTS